MLSQPVQYSDQESSTGEGQEESQGATNTCYNCIEVVHVRLFREGVVVVLVIYIEPDTIIKILVLSDRDSVTSVSTGAGTACSCRRVQRTLDDLIQ